MVFISASSSSLPYPCSEKIGNKYIQKQRVACPSTSGFDMSHMRQLTAVVRVEGTTRVLVRKQPYQPRRGMPYHCVAGGCSRTSDDGVLMHKFPTDASLDSKWSKVICIHCANWTGPSSSSRLCSLHFTSDCYDGATIMRKKLRLEDKRLNLK